MTRRNFLERLVQATLGLSALGFLAPIFSYLAPRFEKGGRKQFTDVRDKPISAKEIGEEGSQIGLMGGEPTIVVRQGGELLAFSAVCTHLGCIVHWEAGEKIFFCSCHAGKFDSNGVNIAGPPPRPLRRYKVVVGREGEIELESEKI